MDTAVVQLIEVLGPPLINLFENLIHPDKKAAVVAAIAAHPAAQGTDPAEIADAVQAKYDAMKADGSLGAQAPAPMTADEMEAEIQRRVAAGIAQATSKEGKAPHGVVFGGGGESTVVHG